VLQSPVVYQYGSSHISGGAARGATGSDSLTGSGPDRK
jgi:hypothetical protein